MLNILTKLNEAVYIKSAYPTTSNLIGHLKQPNDQDLAEYLKVKDKYNMLQLQLCMTHDCQYLLMLIDL